MNFIDSGIRRNDSRKRYMSPKRKFSHFNLDNGIEVVVYPIKEVEAVSIQVAMLAGSSSEDEDKVGTLHFLEHLLFQGSKKYPTQMDVALNFEEIGASHDASVSALDTKFWFFAPDSKVKEALENAYEMISNPIFPDRAIENSRQVILTEQQDFWDIPENQFRNGYIKARWGEKHPYTRVGFGEKNVVAALDKEKIWETYNRYFIPPNFKIAIAGNIDEEMAQNLLNNTFGSWKKDGKVIKDNDLRLEKINPTYYIFNQPRKQVNIGISFSMKGQKDYDIKKLLSLGVLSFLVGGGFTSVLYQRLREELGLVYSIWTVRSIWPYVGSFDVVGKTSTENLKVSMDEIFNTLDGIKKNGFKESDFRRAINYLNMNSKMHFSDPRKIADYFLGLMLDELEMYVPEDYIRIANSIKISEINELAQEVFDFKSMGMGLMGDEKLIFESGVKNIYGQLTSIQ